MKNGLKTGKIVLKSGLILSLVILISLAGCSKQFAKIEENQAQMQSMVQSNAEYLANLTKNIERNQNELIAQLKQAQKETEVVANNVKSLSEQQVMLHESSQDSINQIAGQLSHVSANQEVLKTGLVVSHNETAKVAGNVAALEQKQVELYSTVQNNDKQLTEKVTSLEHGQSGLLASIEDSKKQTLKVSSEVAALGGEQAKLYESSQNSISQLSEQLNKVSANQEFLKTDLAESHDQIAKVAGNVAALEQKQAELYSTVQNNDKQLTEKIALLEHGQNGLLASIEDSKKQTLKVSSEVAALGSEQTKLHESSHNSINQIAGQLSQVSANQEILKTGLVVSHNETAKVGNNVSLLNQTQKELNGILENNNDKIIKRVTVIELNQSDLQAGFDKMQNETRAVAENISSIGKEQTNLHETVNEYNQQMSEWVDSIEKNNLEWTAAIQQMRESVKQVAGNIGIFEKNLSKLQEILQGKIGDLAAVSTAGKKEQAEYQEQMKKDLLALVESMNAIKESQSQLQKKIVDVQSKTDNIAIQFPIAIEQLRKELTIEEANTYTSDN